MAGYWDWLQAIIDRQAAKLKPYFDALSITAGSGECDRSLALACSQLRYVLRRSERKTMSLQIDHRGLRVLAPKRVAAAEIERFVRAHQGWVLERLAAQAAASEARRRLIEDGAVMCLGGEQIRLRLAKRSRGVVWRTEADGVAALHLPAARPQAALERAVRARAMNWFEPRVARYCANLGVAAPRVSLTSAATRWGSCSLRSGIRLHWKLLLLAPELADYVVAHEVAHLREMNHSPAFWALVAELCPEWRGLRRRLREEGARVPEFVSPDSGQLSEGSR